MPVKKAVTKAQEKPHTRRRAKAEESPTKVTVYRTIDDGNPNDPQSEREFITTEALPLPEGWSIEEWLQRTAGPGRYRAEYRAAHGRVVEVDKILIGAVQQQGIADNGAPETGLELLDEDEFSDDPVTNLRIRNAKLSTKLEAISQNGAHGSIGELLQGLRALDEMRGQSAPQKTLAEQLRELREVNEIINPRRESAPSPTPQPQVDPKVSALKIIAENPNMIEIAKDVFGLKRDADSDPWADAFSKLLDHPQFAQIAQGAINMAGNVFSGIASMFDPKPAPMPARQAPQAQGIEPTQPAQQPQQVAPEAPQQVLPETQQPQAAQTEQGPMQMAPVDALIYSLIQLAEKQASVGEAVTLINVSVVRNPELGDSIDELLNLPVDQVLSLLTAYHSPVAQMSHAREWLTALIDTLTGEGGEFDQVTEIEKGDNIKL